MVCCDVNLSPHADFAARCCTHARGASDIFWPQCCCCCHATTGSITTPLPLGVMVSSADITSSAAAAASLLLLLSHHCRHHHHTAAAGHHSPCYSACVTSYIDLTAAAVTPLQASSPLRCPWAPWPCWAWVAPLHALTSKLLLLLLTACFPLLKTSCLRRCRWALWSLLYC
jgi:hypothetical protein